MSIGEIKLDDSVTSAGSLQFLQADVGSAFDETLKGP